MLNEISIIGRVGNDPELRHLEDGKGVCSLSIATDKKYKDSTGEFKSETTWFRVSCWGATGENASKFLHKGSLVFVSGSMKKGKAYQNKAGEWDYSLEVNAHRVVFLDSKKDKDQSGEIEQATVFADPPKDDLPF